MKEILVSVIVPIFNMEQYLSKCIDSILNQTYACLEIILIDDGSTDSSLAICDKYAQQDSRVKVFHKKNGGVSSARNIGLDKSTGDYVSFVDPDDWIEKNMYETLISYLLTADVDILHFNAIRKGEILNELPFSGVYQGEKYEKEILLPMIGSEKFGGMFILGVLWIHLFRRSLIEQFNIRFNTQLMRCEDRLFTITSMFFAKNMIFVDDCLYHYEVYDDSLSNRYNSERWQQESIYLKELKNLCEKSSNKTFIEDANDRIANDCILRVVTSINQEFFSNNSNTFGHRYINLNKIINNPIVKDAVSRMKSENLGLKGQLLIWMIKKRFVLLLNMFNTSILLKNKLSKNG